MTLLDSLWSKGYYMVLVSDDRHQHDAPGEHVFWHNNNSRWERTKVMPKGQFQRFAKERNCHYIVRVKLK